MPHPFEALQLNKGNLQRLLGSFTTGVVTSVSGGTTGLTPVAPTGGAVTLSGILNVVNGGTGVTTSTGSGSAVLNISATLVAPTIGIATGTALSLTGNLTAAVVTATGSVTAASTTSIASGGSLIGLKFFNSTGANFGVFGGTGSPTIVANRGSLYLDGSGRPPFYNTNDSTSWRQLSPTTELVIRTQVFAVSGTYSPHGAMVYCQSECWGGGGAGGSTATAGASIGSGGAGGGAGSYSRTISSRAAIGASQTVTIGAAGTPAGSGNNPGGNGGDSSVGVLCVGKGGTGGGGSSGSAGASGGLGGTAGTGDITSTGQPGGSTATVASFVVTGMGGSTLVGGGGLSVVSATTTTGTAGTGHGSGGSGGGSFNAGGAAAGGAGTTGYVVITEWCSS